MPDVSTVLNALATAVGALEGGGENRSGQRHMCEAVSNAIASGTHLVVAAGTGTGKSLAYLVPLVLDDGPSVVTTATKTLQDQLFQKDLPQLAQALEREINFALLKGRSNYLCLQRLKELVDDGQLSLDLADQNSSEISRLAAWSQQTNTGDRAELSFQPSDQVWDALSVSGRECPGAQRCPSGENCFAEKACDDAAAADIVVVNTHLYSLHVFSEVPLLPEHKTVVIDEAHGLEDIVSDTAGLALNRTRFDEVARSLRAAIASSDAADVIEDSGKQLHRALELYRDKSLPNPLPDDLQQAIVLAQGRVNQGTTELKAIPNDAPAQVVSRKQRAILAATALTEDLNRALKSSATEVAWVSGSESSPTWRIAPLEVGTLLAEKLWGETTAVLTSATIPMNLPETLGLAPDAHDVLDVGSPFDYQANAVLYCPKHLPDPRHNGYQQAVHDEMTALISAAEGRTLALFTSYKAMDQAAEALRPKLNVHIYTQRDLPHADLLRRFSNEVQSCLFATMSMWQGIDVPGESLSLVTIDRLPFPRPDDPLLNARRKLYDNKAFYHVDLPRAATRLAQGVGRLIRSSTDRGVVAVLDSRMAQARYRWDLVKQLPQFRRTSDREEAIAVLQSICNSAADTQ
ncbi:MAG: ATP-dependent DNA helicase [Acidimicrobiia bacterium]|nr:ATP-dependent DNA helicase [Acidimicrobiia bacterium]MYC57404.1 ATP-dependent DNA helicase [Acidimicrobiia bacterium]MYI30242.1 ATP-dependent DNA helicase [Acidimicrobiia bacterium]